MPAQQGTMLGYPKLRPDLEAFPQQEGPGHRTVILKDPVSQKYFRLTEFEYRFLLAMDGTRSHSAVSTELSSRGYHYGLDDAREILTRATQAGLLLGTHFGTASFLLDLKRRLKSWKRSQRLSQIYFLFVPLVSPDRFLGRTVDYVRWLWSPWFAGLACAALPGAVYILATGWPSIQREFLFFFNLKHLVYLWVTVALTKLVHELSHAYVAKSFGLRVPAMGVAFLIFFPCLYCNTTEAWQLADRRQRMAISAAGVLAEAVIALCSVYVWHTTRPGVIHSLAFYLMGVSMVSTVLFNGNPLMKFDGYFLLTDYLRLPNLFQKSQGYLRYCFMNSILGISSIRDPSRTPRERWLFTLYGTAAFAYRMALYYGIVVAVYYRFDKTLGILLAALAFGLFVVRPIWRGSVGLYYRRSQIRPRLKGSLIIAGLLVCGSVILFVPVGGNSVFPCHVDAASKQKLTVPMHTWVDSVLIREGATVKKGAVLFRLDTSLLRLNLAKQEVIRNTIKAEADLLLVDDQRRAELPGKEIEFLQAEDEIRRIKERLVEAQDGFIAPFDGVVTRLDPKMKPGYQPGEGTIIGEFESTAAPVIHALVPEMDLAVVREGERVRVWLPVDAGVEFGGRIQSIRPFSEPDLRASPFSSRLGGDVPTEVKNRNQMDVPLEAQYDCSVVLDRGAREILLGMTGKLIVGSPRRSIARRVFDRLMQTLNRESLL
ncbi:MAG: efflux RND transporter periplasmic adaptor subunit [Thermodesulfobacteriota bacterium]